MIKLESAPKRVCASATTDAGVAEAGAAAAAGSLRGRAANGAAIKVQREHDVALPDHCAHGSSASRCRRCLAPRVRSAGFPADRVSGCGPDKCGLRAKWLGRLGEDGTADPWLGRHRYFGKGGSMTAAESEGTAAVPTEEMVSSPRRIADDHPDRQDKHARGQSNDQRGRRAWLRSRLIRGGLGAMKVVTVGLVRTLLGAAGSRFETGASRRSLCFPTGVDDGRASGRRLGSSIRPFPRLQSVQLLGETLVKPSSLFDEQLVEVPAHRRARCRYLG